jgi:malonyl-CoA O-methyltransferase
LRYLNLNDMNLPKLPSSHSDRPEIDSQQVRRLFEQLPMRLDARTRSAVTASASTSTSIGDHDFIVREVSRRMAERLEYIKLNPRRALDAGCGRGADLAALQRRFPEAQWQALDGALPPLLQAQAAQRASRGFFERLAAHLGLNLSLNFGAGKSPPNWLCADFAELPLAPRTLDFIWSNLALHWHAAPHQVFPEWARTLNVGGLVLFSAFGPDSLKEVSAAFAGIDRAPHVLPFTDMHDYGDMLVASGFATPVVDMERLTLTYADRASLWRDVRALGGNGLAGRRRGLLGRAALQRVNQALDAQRDAHGRYPLTFEIIYGHAWKGQPRTTAEGHAIVQLDLPRKVRPASPGKPRPA